jgi:hypothetical protein
VQLAHFRLQLLYLSILLNLQNPKPITSKRQQLATLHMNDADFKYSKASFEKILQMLLW